VSYADSVEFALEQVGEPLTLRKDSGGTYNADTGAYTAGPSNSDSDFSGRVSKFDSRLVNGTTVLGGDLEVMAVGFDEGVEPLAGDQMIRGDKTFSILGVDPETIGTDVMFYRLHVRGA